MRTILLPTDFSETAWNAIEYTLKVFRGDACRMILIHAYSPPFFRMDYAFGGPEVSAIADPETDRVIQKLEALQQRLIAMTADEPHEIRTHAGFNSLPEVLRTVASQTDADLVVMGTDGLQDWKDRLFGSSTTEVIKHIGIPLLIVPGTFAFRQPKRILLATDLATNYRLGDLDSLLWICSEQIADLTVLHLREDLELTEEQKACKRDLDLLLSEVPYTYKEGASGLMPDGLLKYLNAHKPDLAVMTRHAHSFLERMLLKQQSEQVSAATPVPLLMLPETNSH